jgi:hypothetical protein
MKKGMLVLAFLSLSGCVSANVMQLGQPGQYRQVRPEEVRVYVTEADINVPFEKVAIITAKGDYQTTNEEKMLKKIRQKAAEAGANAVILSEFQEPSTAARVWNSLLGTSANRTTRVMAIRVNPEDGN